MYCFCHYEISKKNGDTARNDVAVDTFTIALFARRGKYYNSQPPQFML